MAQVAQRRSVPPFRWRFVLTSAIAHALMFLSAMGTIETAVSDHDPAPRAVTLVYRTATAPAGGLAERATGRVSAVAERGARRSHEQAASEALAREPSRRPPELVQQLPEHVQQLPELELRPRVFARALEREEVDYFERARASMRDVEHAGAQLVEPPLATAPQPVMAPRAETSASAAYDLSHREHAAVSEESHARAASTLRPPPQQPRPQAWELLRTPELVPTTLGAPPLELVAQFHPVSAAFFSPAFMFASVTPLAPAHPRAPAIARTPAGTRVQTRENEVTLFDPSRDRSVQVSVSARRVDAPGSDSDERDDPLEERVSPGTPGDPGEAADLEVDGEGGAPNLDQASDMSEIAKKVARVLPLVYWDWQRRGQLAGRTAVRFRLDSDGYARDVRVERSSGSRALERESNAALLLASPFDFVPGWIELSLTFRG